MSRREKIFLIALLAISITIAAAWPAILSLVTEYKEVSFTLNISRSGTAKAVEEINPRTIVSTITIQTISPTVSNVLATDEKNTVLSSSLNGNLIRIDTLGASHVTLTYDVSIVKESDKVWDLNYNSTNIDSKVILPPNADIIAVNNVPIDINGTAITMPAGQVSISYVVRSISTNNFIVTENGTNHTVQIVTTSKLGNFNFDYNSKSISFKMDNKSPTLVIIPRDLLEGTYQIHLNEKLTTFKEYYQNSTHSWIRIDPQTSGKITITGKIAVVPEFGSISLLILLASIIFSISLLLYKRKLSTLEI